MSKEMEQSDAKKYYFRYDFACKKVPLPVRYVKNYIFARPVYFTPRLYGVNRVFFPLGQKTIANSTFYDTYLCRTKKSFRIG
jgi:hypothetical protein